MVATDASVRIGEDVQDLVATEWLDRHLDDEGLVVVDMRWRGDGTGRELFARSRIPGAVHLDWSADIVDVNADVAFMLAPPGRFAAAMRRSGIGDRSRVVAYADQHGSGPFRLWWAFRTYGHGEIAVLDGGFEKWEAEGRPVESGPPRPREPAASWTPRPGARMGATAEDVEAARSGGAVLDSRPRGQFRGQAVWFETGPILVDASGIAVTPRGPLRGGRVPWARNVPAAELYAADGTMKSPDELRELLSSAGAALDRPVVTYCGVGISASALLFAAVRAGFDDVSLYDASWEEWGRDPRRPVARG